ncbi:uncharacterized protein LOC124899501 [Capsicum annuum]|uniref:uncharacterized protein LOC124899501 n=1 Tax=Capsicum annuum TaxID=4072 RepID=UPI001FB05569|nr:uncharacterized protein LOC124899501 [Capsicum annuum]
MKDTMMKFASRLSYDLILKSKLVLLSKDIDISKLVMYIQLFKEENKKQVKIEKRLCKQVHPEFCEEGRNKCFKYGQIGHMQRNFPLKAALGTNKIHVSTLSAPTTKGAASTSGTIIGKKCLYALTNHQDFEESPDVVTIKL